MTWCDSTTSYWHHSLLSSVINWVETLFLGALRYSSIWENGFSFTSDCAAIIYILLFSRERKTSPTLCCYSEGNASPSNSLVTSFLLEWLTFWQSTVRAEHEWLWRWLTQEECVWRKWNFIWDDALFVVRVPYSDKHTNKLTSSDLCVIFASVSLAVTHYLLCILVL